MQRPGNSVARACVDWRIYSVIIKNAFFSYESLCNNAKNTQIASCCEQMKCDTDTGVCVCWMKMDVELGGGEVGSRQNYT